MKQLGKDLAFAVVVGMLIPGLLLNAAWAVWNRAVETERENAARQQNVTVLPVRLRSVSGTVTEEEMDEYLVGVVLAEMPASFEPEALKAQAVVARTYARKAWETGGKHGDGSVCVSPTCCQGWKSEADYLGQGGREEDILKVRQAVRSTSGQVLTYEGSLIEATYFSCSGGRTEDAVAVWGTEFPYLQAVDSPGEEGASCYTDRVTLSVGEVERRLGISLTVPPKNWVGDVTYTQGGGVDTIVIGGRYFTGTEVRALLGLRSTAFSITVQPDSITVDTRGYGHRVGMSQYGADAMAALGHTYKDILAHYYQGTELTMVEEQK